MHDTLELIGIAASAFLVITNGLLSIIVHMLGRRLDAFEEFEEKNIEDRRVIRERLVAIEVRQQEQNKRQFPRRGRGPDGEEPSD